MSLYHKLLTVHPTTIKYLPLSECFYSGCVFIVTRTEVLGSSLLVRQLATPKVPGSNPGILGVEGRNFLYCFQAQKGPPGGDRNYK